MDETPLHIRLVDSLLELHRRKASAVLRLEAGSVKKQLVIRGGRLAFVESNEPGEHLARVMLKMKLIPRTDLARVTAVMKAGKSSDQAILDTCRVNPSDLENGAREQALTVLASLFPWDECQFHCYPGEAFRDRLLNLQAPLPEFIVEAVRRAVAGKCVPNQFRSLKGTVAPADAVVAGRLDIPLDRFESYACSLVSGPTAIEGLLPLLPPAGTKPADLVQRLLLVGLIRIVGDEVARPGACRLSRAEEVAAELEALTERFKAASLYEILSVQKDASVADIKSAYHSLARQYHPDRFQSDQYNSECRAQAETLFTYITGAYTTLADPAARIAYDESRLKQGSSADARNSNAPAGDEKGKMAETLFRAARSALAAESYDKAVERLQECVWLCPDNARYHHFLGLAQTEIPKLRKQAETHLLKAVELNEPAVESRVALGKLYVKANLFRRARAQFEEVLRWDPGNREALEMLDKSGK